MEKMSRSRQRIESVDVHSPAARAGVLSGEILCAINGEPVFDLVDYEYLTANARLTLTIEDNVGDVRSVHIRKEEIEPLGLNFQTTLMSDMRSCSYRCVFCFVDQMPKGLRPSLSVKDDDWRLSFIMGNYVTLTNASDAEFERILKRRVSPLYVSVHATDPEVRVKLMGNRTAGRILERLQKLKENGLKFHTQIVLCPGLNDGKVLEKTLSDLRALYPAAQSVAIVPVGLTRFRDGLYPLRPCTEQEARDMVTFMERFQSACREELGTSFAFLSDEWYLKAGMELPPYAHYEDFSQIENGVGMLRLYEEEFLYALEGRKPLKTVRHVSMAGGTGSAGFFGPLCEKLRPYGIELELFPIRNEFFGGNVNVAGLVTGQDLVGQLKGKLKTETLLLPKNMLREKEDVFLDDMTLDALCEMLGVRVIPVSGGEDLINTLFGEK